MELSILSATTLILNAVELVLLFDFLIERLLEMVWY